MGGCGVTDREALLALLDRFGIQPAPETTELDVILREGEGGVGGYMEFFAEFRFDDDGSFKFLGVWE